MLARIKSDEDSDDDWHSYFRVFGGRDWIDVAREGDFWLGVALGEEIEDYSRISNITHAVSGQATTVAFERIGKILGLDGQTLDVAVGHWLEMGQCDSVGFDELMKAYREVLSWRQQDRAAREV